jgi:hypothetical protein
MSRKKTSDPRRIALLDKQARLQAEFERSYSRMRRAFHRMEKARAALIRVARRLEQLYQPVSV